MELVDMVIFGSTAFGLVMLVLYFIYEETL